jgi:membrane protease YdiL (CAAX protease family)
LLLLGHDFASVTSSLFDPIRIQAAIGLGPITANGSIFEEIVLRGIVLTLFLKAYSKRKAIVMSAVAFGVMHYLNLMNGPLTFNSFIFVNGMVIWTTIHGLMYAVMFLKVGNLFPNMALHWTVNGLGNCLILLPGSSTVTYVLFNILFNIGLMSSILGIAWILLVNKYWPLTGNE